MVTQRHLRGHEQCRACGPDGFLIEGPGPFQDRPGSLTVETCLSEAHQGWIHVPHGGIGMALILELARSHAPDGEGCFIDYPFRGSFRWGGPAVSIGERVAISIEPQPGRIRGSIWKAEEQASFPYLSAVLTDCAVEPEALSSRALSLVESLGTDLKARAFELPRYRECFVCGFERQAPGLRCTFYLIQQNGTKSVFSFHGLDPDDEDHFYWLRISDKELHPGVVASVMDEVMGWSGFVTCKQGGVTVKIEIDFLRPVSPGERLLCCGRCTHVKGRGPHRQFWFSEAMVLPLLGDDHVPVAVGRGQWLAVPMLTEEMKSNLLPRSAVLDLFS